MPDTNWSLFVRTDGVEIVEFFEVRQNGGFVWTAQGMPFTVGVSELTELAGCKEAQDLCRQKISGIEALGFVLLHRDSYAPGELDFGKLEKAIQDGSREAYLAIRNQNPEERINGFALFTDFDGMTICSAAMSTSSFEDIDEDPDYYRTNPSEWPLSSDQGLLLAYRMILIPSYQGLFMPFEAEVPDYVDRFFETCTRALEQLDQDGLFGKGESRNEFLLLFGVSDGGPTKAAVRRLNPPSVFQRYKECFDDDF